MQEKPFQELVRRLNAEGYQFKPNGMTSGTVYRHGYEVADLKENGDIHYGRENRAYAQRIRNLYAEVNEYMTAYLQANPALSVNGEERHRTLLQFAGYELAGKPQRDRFEFVTWQSSGGDREVGHYFTSYAAAKEDFALRCGLIDQRKLFTETELLIIRAGLVQCADITPDQGVAEARAIRSLVEKISDIIIPQIAEQEEMAEEMEMEAELEL